MKIIKYNSSIDPNLTLTAEFHIPSTPKPLCLFFHGWHMTAAESRRAGVIEPLLKDFFVVNVDMRGRGGSSGKPDASGHELIDGLDALSYARENFPDKISGGGVYAVGGSGGGGNVLALAGKAPDTFSAAVSWAGISDYAVLYRLDKKGSIRDEMEEKGWIGGSPDTNPEGYIARSGLSIIENVFTRLLVIHGRKDYRVPVISAQQYEARARQLKKNNIEVFYNNKGHSSIEWEMSLKHLRENKKLPGISRKGRLLVHSFLALRSFMLVLEDPSDMGFVDYALDDKGDIQSLTFHKTYSKKQVNSYLFRLFNDGKMITVKDKTGKNLEITRSNSPYGNSADFIFQSEGFFHMAILT